MNSISRDSRGQTLLEAIIALGIISTAVVAALTLTSSAINASTQSQNLLVAGNLGREAIEAVRSIRDSNWLAGIAWDTGLAGVAKDYGGSVIFSPATNSWSVDYSVVDVNDIVQPDSAQVYRYTTASGNAVVGLMVQAVTQPSPGTVATPYNRFVVLSPLCDDGLGGYTIAAAGADCGVKEKIGIRVQAYVRWAVGSGQRVFTLEERMFNWR